MSDTQIPTLTTLGPDQVLALEVEGTALWFIKNTADGSEKAGPFTEENLRDYILAHQDFSPDFVANKLGTDEWTTVVELAEFKRKPKLVSMAAINSTASFYLLDCGHKVGPFDEAEINQKLKNKELIFSDFISVDKGFNWLKIFELPQFDSRTASLAEALPLSPTEEVFKISKLQGLKNIQDNQVSKDILAFVAFASKRKTEVLPETPAEEKGHWWGQHKKMIYASLSLFVFASFSWKYFTTPGPSNVAEEADSLETMFANVAPTQAPSARAGIPQQNQNRAPAANGIHHPMQLNHTHAQSNNIPVPIEDAQINYDEPTPPEAPDPVEPPPPPEAAQVNPPEEQPEPQQVAEAEPMPEADREPANMPEPAMAPPPGPAPSEAEMFNQEAQN